jgi:adenosylcobinamide-GDP ribazoletransferase
MAAAVTVLPYARPGGGLASAFRDRPAGPLARASLMVGGTAAALLLAYTGTGVPGVIAAAAALATGIAVLAFAQVRLGGFTGDVLGAAGLIAESAGLVVAGAKW